LKSKYIKVRFKRRRVNTNFRQLHLPVFTFLSFGSITWTNSPAYCDFKENGVETPDPVIFEDDGTFVVCDWEMQDQIGVGAYGTVWKGYHVKDGTLAAVKVISKESLSEQDIADVRREVKIQRELSHQTLVRCVDYQETDQVICIAMEYLSGGELFEGLLMDGPYSERDACTKLRPVFEGLAYMHSKGYTHHDIHPANLCFSDESQTSLKIIDFGLAFHESQPPKNEIAGTLDYVAPEILTGQNVGPKIDAFALGVIVYIVLCGKLPFNKANHNTWGQLRARYKHLRMHKPDFSSEVWASISDEAKDLVKGLLKPRYEQRLSVDEALKHPWLRGAFMDGEYLQVMEDLKSTSDTAKKEKLREWLNSQGFIYSDSSGP